MLVETIFWAKIFFVVKSFPRKQFGRKIFLVKLFLLQNHFLGNSLDEQFFWSILFSFCAKYLSYTNTWKSYFWLQISTRTEKNLVEYFLSFQSHFLSNSNPLKFVIKIMFVRIFLCVSIYHYNKAKIIFIFKIFHKVWNNIQSTIFYHCQLISSRIVIN